GLKPAEMADYLNKKSGFLGISGVSSDHRDVEAAAFKGDKRSILTCEMLAYGIQKYIGAFSAAMNGLDVLIFTGGIGENAPHARQDVCENMEFFGIKVDKDFNLNLPHGQQAKISTPDSKVEVWVIPTNEELLIARDTKALCNL
ncbi:MAG: acetate kinase, partial [Ruminiclostridium sp.]|nr:acetate kinase [Ruminiclostridium sp.]